MQEPEYILIRDVGPPHARIFTIRCKISNFEEDGTATTKKQAKHDAAKRMVDRIKGLVNNPNDSYTEIERTIEEASNPSVGSIDIELINKNAEERFRALTKMPRKINLGIKLADYHVKWKNSLETVKRDQILEQLECIFPNEFFNNNGISNEFIMEKISELKTVLSEFDVMINMMDINVDSSYFMKAIELNTCPILTQIGMGKDNVEASWVALCQMIKTLKLLLS